MKKMPNTAMGAWAWGNNGTFGNQYAAADLEDVYAAAMKHGLNLWDTAEGGGYPHCDHSTGRYSLGDLQGDIAHYRCDEGASGGGRSKAAQITLTGEEIQRLERTADETEVSTIRYWEKVMK